MGWYGYKRKKKKWKPGFWTIVIMKSPDGHEVKLKLNITPEAIKKWVLPGAAWPRVGRSAFCQ